MVFAREHWMRAENILSSKAALEDGDLDFSLVGFSGEAAVLLPPSLRISRGK